MQKQREPLFALDYINRFLRNVACKNMSEMMALLHVSSQAEKAALINAPGKYGQTALIITARRGFRFRTKLLIDNGADVNTATNYGGTPLMYAALYGHDNVVQELVKIPGIKIDAVNKDGNSALMYAASRGHLNIVKMLLQAGACLKKQNRHGQTAWFACIRNNHLDTVKFISDKIQADNQEIFLPQEKIDNCKTSKVVYPEKLNFTVPNGGTLLHLFILGNIRPDLAHELLIDKPQLINTVNIHGETPLLLAVERQNIELIDVLLTHDQVDVNKANENGVNPLMLAFELKNDVIIEKLLAHKKIDVNVADANGTCPLQQAIWQDKQLFVEQILTKKPNLSHVDKDGNSPLIAAINTKNCTILQKLIEAGFSINKSACGCCVSPLYHAMNGQDLNVIRLLLNIQAQINVTGEYNITPLLNAIIRGNYAIAKELLINKADHTIAESQFGVTPLLYAVKKNSFLLVKLLLDYGANPNTTMKNGTTPLMQAAYLGFKETLILLLEKNAGIHQIAHGSKNGKTALDHAYASASPHKNEIIKILKAHGAK